MDLVELAKILWKRRIWIAVTAAIGTLVGGFGSFLITPSYRAATMILVEPQKVPSDYVKSTVTSTMLDRLKTIEQQITNRSNLIRIIEEMGLYPDVMAAGEVHSAVARARRDLTIRKRDNHIFEVFFTGEDPILVAAVANRIAEAFIEENLKMREGQAQSTSAFLERELAQTRGQLEAQEARVTDFRRRHEGALPEQQVVTQTAIAQFERKLEIKEESLDERSLRRLLLDRGVLKGGRPAPADEAASLGGHLEELRMELMQLQSRYTARHPDVVRTRAEIERLESQLASRTDVAGPVGDPQVAAEIEALDQEVVQIQLERDGILVQIEGLQSRLERTPYVEQQLLILNRDYGMTQDQHDSLLRKLTEARLAENLEKTKQSEQFEILDEAVAPQAAYWPNRSLLAGTGLALGLFLGGILAWLREETDPTFTDLESLERAFPGVVVMAGVPKISMATDASGLTKLADDDLIAGKQRNKSKRSKRLA